MSVLTWCEFWRHLSVFNESFFFFPTRLFGLFAPQYVSVPSTEEDRANKNLVDWAMGYAGGLPLPPQWEVDLILYHRIYAWCWLSGSGGWLGISGSWIWALLAAQLAPGGVDSACHPSEVGEMSTTVLVYRGTASVAQSCPKPMHKLYIFYVSWV